MKFKLILLFLILFLLCGAVSAVDENETDISSVAVDSTPDIQEQNVQVNASDSVESILSATSQDVISADDSFRYKFIQNEILNTNKSVISLKKGTYRFGDGDSGLGMFVNRPVTIDGNGSTFICSDQIFLIKADNVVLKNITFTYTGKLTLTPHIIQWVGSNAVVENCIFNHLIFDSPHGGAINWRGQNLTIVQSKFDEIGIDKKVSDDTKWYSGRMKETSSGGAISITSLDGFNTLGNIIIVNTTFNKCSAGYSGGAIYLESMSDYADYVLLNNTRFTNCISGENALMSFASMGNLTILNSDFKNNHQFSHEGASDSGQSMIMLSSNDILIDNCNFIENEDYSGGGLLNFIGGYLSGKTNTNVTTVIRNSKFIGNNEYKSDEYEYLSNTIYLMSGPLIQYQEEILNINKKCLPEIINCYFDSNYQSLAPEFDDNQRPFMITAYGVYNSTFNYNNALGGSILNPYTGVYNCTFRGNEANFSVVDDGIVNEGYEVINSSFSYNVGHHNGIIYNPNRVINCSFFRNEVDMNGGAIYLGKYFNVNQKTFETVVLNNSFYHNNALNGSGGAIFSEFQKMLHINNSLFIGNSADHDALEIEKGCGGALFVDFVTINDSNFTNNNARNGVGGAIYVKNKLYVNNSTFYENRAEGKRKLIEWDAGYGGAILSYAGSFLINNSAFHYNQADQEGAAICCMELNLFNSNFTNNSGPSAVYFIDNVPNIMNCTFLHAYSDPNYDNETRHLYSYLSRMSVVNVVNNTFDVWDSDLKANQTNNISSWVLISGFFNPGFNFEIPDLYLENESGLLFSVPVKNNQQIGKNQSDVYNLTGLVPGKYIAHHYYKDMRGNIYIPKNNLTNITFYIGRYISSINGTYNTTNTTVYFVLEQTEYNDTLWTVFNSTGNIILTGNNNTFIKKNNYSCLNFIDLDAGNYTIILNVSHEDKSFNLTCNFTVSKAKSSVLVNTKNIPNGVYNTAPVMINVTICNQTFLKIIINSTTNSSLYNISVNINNGNATFDIVKGNESYPDIIVNSILKQSNNTNNYLFSIFGLDVDKYIIHFNNTESKNYNSSYCNKTFEVSRANSLINITNITNGIYDTRDVLINVSILNQTDFSFMIYNSTGNMTVNVTLIGENVNLSINRTGNFNDTIILGSLTKQFNLTYYYKFTVSALNAGNYNIIFLNNQSRNYKEYKLKTSFKVNKASSKVNITNIEDSLYNTTKTIVAVSVLNQTKFSFNITNATTQIIVGVEINGSDINLTINKKINVTITPTLVSHNNSDYNYTFEIIGLNAGKYNITMSNAENTNYNSTHDNHSFVVFKVNSTVLIKSVINATYNASNVTITYNVLNETKVSFIIVDKETGANFTVVINNAKFELVNVTKGLDIGNYMFNLSKIDNDYVLCIIGVESGNYTIAVINHESMNYYSSNDTCKFTISKSNSLVNISNVSDGVYDTCDVLVNVSVSNQTNVSLVVSNATHNFTVNLIVNSTKVSFKLIKKDDEFAKIKVGCRTVNHMGLNYNYTLTISGLERGKYNITVLNSPSDNYNESFDKNSFIVLKANSTVNITTADGIFNTTNVVINFTVTNQSDLSKVYFVIVNSNGDKVNVTLSKIMDGAVETNIKLSEIFDNVTMRGNVVNAGLIYKYSFVISNLGVGNYNVTVYNGEARNYTSSKSNASFNVSKANSKIDLNVADGVYDTVNVTVNVNVFNQTKISLFINNKVHNFTVKVDDDVVTVIGKVNEFENVDVVINKAKHNGLNYNFTFIVSGLNAGKYNITVLNDESVSYNSFEVNRSFIVYKASSNISIVNVTDGIYNTCDVEVNVSAYNKTNVSLVIGNASHNFTVYVNDGVLTYINKTGEFTNVQVEKTVNYNGLNYNYTFIISGLNAGDYNILMQNVENELYNSSNEEYGFRVLKASSRISIIDVANSIFNTTNNIVKINVLNETDVSFVVSNSTHSFKVNVSNNKIDIIRNNGEFEKVKVVLTYDGNYTFAISGLNAGIYNVTFFNAQSRNYNCSDANSSFNVEKANSTVKIEKVSDGAYNVSSVNITYDVVNETVFSYFIKNKESGLNFTVKFENNKFKIIDASEKLDTSNYDFDLTRTEDCHILTISGMDGGEYTIQILNQESTNYNPSNDTKEFKVLKTTSSITIVNVTDGIYATYGVVVNVSILNQTEISIIISNETHKFVGIVKEGKVNLESGNILIAVKSSSHSTSNYNYTFVISGLDVGKYNLTVLNNKSENYESSIDNSLFRVIKASSNVDIATINGVYDTRDVVVNVTIANQTNLSKVYLEIVNSNGDKFDVTLVDVEDSVVSTNDTRVIGGVTVDNLVYEYSFHISGLGVGNYTVYAYNCETIRYNASKASETFNVLRAPSKVNVVAVDGVYNVTDVVVEVNVFNQTDVLLVIGNASYNLTVDVIVNGENLDLNYDGDIFKDVVVKCVSFNHDALNYSYRFVISGLMSDEYDVAVLNSQSDSYYASQNSTSFKVGKMPSNINVVAVDGVYNVTDVVVEVNVFNQTDVLLVIGNASYNLTVDVIVNGENLDLNYDGDIFKDVVVKCVSFNHDALNYSYRFVISGLMPGEYDVAVLNSQSDSYYASQNATSFKVGKMPSHINVTAFDGVYNTTEVLINIGVVNETGVFLEIINDNGKKTVVNITGGNLIVVQDGIGDVKLNSIVNHYILSVDGLNPGKYDVNVYNVETAECSGFNDTDSFVVERSTTKINITHIVEGIYDTRDVSIGIEVVNRTNVTYTIKFRNGTVKVENVSVSADAFTIAGLDAGNYTVVVNNWNNDNYIGSQDSIDFVVHKASSRVNATVFDGVYNTASVILYISVLNETNISFDIIDAKGKVCRVSVSGSSEVIVNDNIGDVKVKLVDGHYKLSIDGLKSGKYSIQINNSESSNYNASHYKSSFIVDKAQSHVSVNAIDGIYNTQAVSIFINPVNRTNVTYTLKDNAGNLIANNLSVLEDNFVLDKLEAGEYVIIVDNLESDNYMGSNDTVNFTVYKANSKVNISAIDGIYDTQDVVVYLTIINQTDYSKVYFEVVNSNGDKFNVTLKNINAGNVICSVESNDQFDVDVVGKVVTDSFVDLTGNPVHKNPKYAYTFVISKLLAGNYHVAAYNLESDNYNASSNSTSFIVHKASSSIDANVSSGVFNTSYVFMDVVVLNETNVSFEIVDAKGKTCICAVNKSGAVIVHDDIGQIKVKLIDGYYKLSIEGLNAGEYTLKIINAESDNYAASEYENSFEVKRADTKLDIIGVVDGVYDTIGVNVTIDVVNMTSVVYTIKYANGTVIFENISVLEDNFIISNLNAGSYILIVDNLDTQNYIKSSATGNFIVSKASSKVNITTVVDGIYDTLPSQIIFDIQNETSVEFIVRDKDGNVLDNYDFVRMNNSVQISGLSSGNYSFEIINQETSNYRTSNDTQKFSISKAASQVIISPIVNVTFNDKNIVVDYYILNKTAHDIVVYNEKGDNVEPLSISDNAVKFGRIAAGNYTIKIINLEDENYKYSYAESNFTVYKAGSSVVINPIKNITYQHGKIIINYGISNRTSDIVFAIINNETGDEIFSVTDYNKEAFEIIPNGNLSYTNYTLGSITPGQYIIKVVNQGNENFSKSVGVAKFEIFAKLIDMNLSTINATYPEKATALITSDVDGDYYVIVNGKQYPVSVVNGTGNVTIDQLDSGNYDVVLWSSVPNYEKINKTAQISIEQGGIDMNVTVVNSTYPDQAQVIINSNANGDYEVTVDGKTYVVKVSGGEGNATLDKLAPGKYDVTVKSNVANYDSVTKTDYLEIEKRNGTTISSTDLVRGFNSDYDFKAMFYDKYGGILRNTAVEFNIGGKTYSVFTDDGGVAFLKLKLDVGNYTVVCKNLVSGDERTNSLKIVKRLIENTNIVTDYNSGYVYKVCVIDDDGTPAGAGFKFTIPINGKYYSYVTDSKGYINIKIDKRFVPSSTKNKLTYRFTLTYKDFTINNEVVIKQILKSKKTVKVKKSARKLVLKATLKKNNGKALKNKKIKFIFKGKTYTAKTDKKGVAKVTIKKNVIKKLKAGKAYAVKISYLTDTIKTFVKVRK